MVAEWMSSTNRKINYPKLKATNFGHSVDAHSQDSAASMSLLVFSVQAANI